MIARRASSFLLAVTLAGCAAGSKGGDSGTGGGTAGSATTTTTPSTGTGGAGGAVSCSTAAGTLSFSGIYSTTFDSTMDPVSSTFGDPSTSTLVAYLDMGTTVIKGQNATWQVEIDLELAANAKLPVTLTPSSFPSLVSGASFVRGAGLTNQFSNGDTFPVTVADDGCRIGGTFSGSATSADGFGLITFSHGAFDVPVTAMQ
jgi:hypothetical protein